MKMIKQEELVSELTNYIGYIQSEHFKTWVENTYNTNDDDTELLVDNMCDTIDLIIAEFGGNRILHVVEIQDELVEYCEEAQDRMFGKFVELVE